MTDDRNPETGSLDRLLTRAGGGGDSTVERAENFEPEPFSPSPASRGGFPPPQTVTEAVGSPGGEANVASPGGSNADTLSDLPGDHEVWKVDGVLYLVWFVPGIEPPFPIMYEVTPDVEIGSVTVDKTLTGAQADAAGALLMGSARMLDRPDDQHPIERFLDTFEAQLNTRPWLSDPEILSKLFGAYLEGRSLTEAELQDTEWFMTHNLQQRQWLVLVNTDPATANQMIADQNILTRNAMIAAGIDQPPEGLIEIIAANLLQGNWTPDYTNDQIARLADPFAPGELDDAITSWINEFDFTPDTTAQFEQDVRDMVSRWLGPSFANGWSDQNVAAWAGEFRNNPDAQDELRAALQGQRLALFPSYTNENLTYEDIAAPWRAFFFNAWGQAPDEVGDPLFNQIVNLNDAGSASQLLRKEGLARGNPTTTLDAIKAFSQGLGGPVVRSDPAVR